MSEPQSGEMNPARIFQMAFGYAPPLILEAAIRHHVFDTLDEGPKTVSQVSSQTGASERGLTAIMNALVGLEFLTKSGDGSYALTGESKLFLVSKSPGYVGGIIKHTSEQLIPKWLNINEVVRTGKPSVAVNQEHGGSEFFHQFVEDIFPMSYPAAQALGDALQLSQATQTVSVLDIAAGSGVWGIALAQKSPNVKVTAVDWPNVLGVTQRVSARFGLHDRFTFVAGDLLEADFGTGHNIATLGHIIHSEGEARSKKLLRKVYDALATGGTIVVAEMVPNSERTAPPFPLIFAVNMLVNTDNGDTYTFEEMSGWLQDVGFKDTRQLDTPGPSPLILATK